MAEDAFTFEQVLQMVSFFILLWASGFLVEVLKGAPLVIHIIIGIVMGPNLLDWVPFYEAVMLFGEIGLMLLVFQAGLEVDLGTLKQLGPRALLLAFVGSFLPMFMGIGILVALGYDFKAAFAGGAALSPTSLGIAVETLTSANVLSSAPGQLITASAVIDDVIGLLILSMLEAISLEDPEPSDYAIPIISSLIVMIFFGGLAVVIPTKLSQFPGGPLQSVPYGFHKPILLYFALTCGFLLAAGSYYARSSYLLGIFIVGLSFCSKHMLEEHWKENVVPLMAWLMRAFFAGTIGFVVPVQTLFKPEVVGKGFLLLIALLGKMATGFFAKPLNKYNFLKIGLAMSAWGEIAFVIANVSRNNGSIDEELFSSIILAVILSTLISPVLLIITLSLEKKNQGMIQEQERRESLKGGLETIYWALLVNCKSKWGLYDRLSKKAIEMDLEVVEARLTTDSIGRAVDQIVYRDINPLPLREGRKEFILEEFKKIINDRTATVIFTRYYNTKEFLEDVDDYVFVETDQLDFERDTDTTALGEVD